jgi:hypothetical protein
MRELSRSTMRRSIGPNSNQPLTIPLLWQGGTLIETSIEGTESGQVVNAKATLQSPFSSCAIGLVKGGWLQLLHVMPSDG